MVDGCIGGGGAAMGVSAGQKGLLEIMELVKAKNISQAKAQELFRDWKMKQDGGQAATSFLQKQVLAFTRL